MNQTEPLSKTSTPAISMLYNFLLIILHVYQMKGKDHAIKFNLSKLPNSADSLEAEAFPVPVLFLLFYYRLFIRSLLV